MIVFTGNWTEPETSPVGKRKIERALRDSRGRLLDYVMHAKNEAAVVAGFHPTGNDGRGHVTVRCNDRPGGHKCTFHLYLKKDGTYDRQTQTFP
jgi:hypothetical protein